MPNTPHQSAGSSRRHLLACVLLCWIGLAAQPGLAQNRIDRIHLPPGFSRIVIEVPPGAFGWSPERDDRLDEIFGDDDDDDDDAGPPSAGDIQALFEGYGVKFGSGTSITWLPGANRLIIVNTDDEIRKIDRIMESGWHPRRQIEITCTAFRVSPQLAADWGLDGLPPGKPDTMPFPDRIPRVLDHEAGLTLFGVLRQDPGFAILAHASVITINGNTATTQSVERLRLAESYSEPDPDLNLPEFSDELEPGVSLAATATIGEDDYTLHLRARPRYTEIVGWRQPPTGGDPRIAAGPIPIVADYSSETRVMLVDGQTIILAAGSGGPVTDPRHGLVFFAVRATLLRPGSTDGIDTRRPVARGYDDHD